MRRPSRADAILREEVASLLAGGRAHLQPNEILERIPARMRGTKPRGLAHSPWELLEHLRLAQQDILKWSSDADHVSPKWPEGYWPASPAPPNARSWERSAREFLKDLRTAVRLAKSRRHDLLAPLRHARGTTLLHELFLIASHNSYHLGQLVDLGRLLRRAR